MTSNPILTIDGKIVANSSGCVCFRDTTPPTVVLSNLPSNPTSETTADIVVGGDDVVAYKYKLDGGDWSNSIPVATHITLTNITSVSHTLSVIGKDIAGNWQQIPTTYTWTVAAVLVSSGLYQHLNANESASYSGSGTTWADISGRNRHATLRNSPTFVSSSPNGKYFTFNGSSQYASLNWTMTQSSAAYQYTIMIAAKMITGTSGTQTQRQLISSDNGNYDWGISAGYNSKYMMATENGVIYSINNQDTAWHVFTGWWGGTSGGKFYIDNVLQGSSPLQYTTNIGATNLCKSGNSGWGEYWSGYVAIVAIYNRALTTEEMTQNYYYMKSMANF